MAEHVPREPLLDIRKALVIMDKISLFGGLFENQLYTIFKLLKTVTCRAHETGLLRRS